MRQSISQLLVLAGNWSLRAKSSPKVGRPLVVGLLSSRSGLGEGARLLVRGFKAIGIEPALLDVTPRFVGHDCVVDIADAPQDDGHGPVIIHLNPPELQALLRSQPPFIRKDRYRIGVWAWEQNRLPWIWRHSAAWVNEVWASSRYLERTFRHQLKVPVYFVPYPCCLYHVDSHDEASSESRALHSGTSFHALACFSLKSSLYRKNPEGALSAFQEAFPVNALETQADDFNQAPPRLTLQSGDGATPALEKAIAADPRVRLVTEPLGDRKMSPFFRQHDVYISLHRAEGFGLSIARALALGIPSIFTDHSGAHEFATAPGAFPIGHGPANGRPDLALYRRDAGSFAEPDIGAAAEALSRIRRSHDRIPKNIVRQWWDTHYGIDILKTQLLSTGLRATIQDPVSTA